MEPTDFFPAAAQVASVVSAATRVLQVRELVVAKRESSDDQEVAEKLLREAREEAQRALDADVELGKEQLNGIVQSGLQRHLRRVAEWSHEIRVEPTSTPRTLSDLFVHLDLECESASGRRRRVTTRDLARRRDSIVLLGQAGGGKTTAARYFASEMLASGGARMPLLIQIRDLRDGQGVMSICQEIVGAPKKVPGFAPLDRAQRERFVLHVLEGLGATLILDGLDEISPPARQDKLLREVARLLQMSDVPVVLTCRKAEYRYALPRAEVFELLPLSKGQRAQLTERWIKDPDDRSDFLRQLEGNPIAGSEMLPLNLAVLVLVYLRSGSTQRSLPDQPSTLYRKLLNLFLSEWDESRGVQRQSAYAAFTKEKKSDFLQNIAYELTVAGHRGAFSHRDLRAAYARVYERFNLPHPREGSEAVIREVESHTGIVIEQGPDSYSFFHLTFQEYLTAQYIIFQGGPHTLRVPWHVCPNEAAVAVAAANEPAVFLAQLTDALMDAPAPDDELLLNALHVFVQRLMTERPALEVGPILGFAAVRLAADVSAAVRRTGLQDPDSPGAVGSMRAFMASGPVVESLGLITASYLEAHPATSDAEATAFRQTAHQSGMYLTEPWLRAKRLCPLPDVVTIDTGILPELPGRRSLPN